MKNIFEIEEEHQTPAVCVHNGKWCYFGDPVGSLSDFEKMIVYGVIIDAVNADLDKTTSLKF